jgi:beta-lactamase regulating signal transducer with metallopeptidase domain
MEEVVLVLYLLGLGMVGVRRAVGWLLLRRVLSRSTSRFSGLLRESPDVTAPVTVGLLRPVVLLPAGWGRWDARTRRAVLAHEFAHIRRRDTWTSALAFVVRSLHVD